MKTIGQILKKARIKKKVSFEKLEEETKIKVAFIKAIEKEKWDALPERPVVAGFIKNLAQALGVNVKQAVAVFRRDYPPKSLRINPKPDVEKKFSWSPRLTFIVGIVAVILLVIGYLGYQYLSFIAPPRLTVDSPVDGQVVTEDELAVRGLTNPQATLKVNNQPVLVEEDGEFQTDIEVFKGTKEVVVEAQSRSGKTTVIHRKIITELNQ
jgi:cytoskeletal protein RodZ